jgi:hypothetical protein
MESLLSRNRGILSLDKIKQLARECTAELGDPPLDDRDFESIWKDATKFIATNTIDTANIGRNGDGHAAATEQQEDPLLSELEEKIPDRDFAEYAINVSKKIVRQEDALIRQIQDTGLSAGTQDPLNLGIMAPTSEGKTYPVVEVMKLFPKEQVWKVGYMSPMTLVRQKGTLVDENNQPIGHIVKKLRHERFLLGTGKKDKVRMVELKEQLSDMLENSKRLINLSGRILLFLEPPHPDLWDKIKPILSHDTYEIEFPYVDKNDRGGFATQNVVIRGWPACIFCSAKDESKWPQWPEIVSRFLITSPNMIARKYQESNLLIAQRKGLPGLLQEQMIISSEEIRLAKLCIQFLKRQIEQLSKENKNPVWIPYTNILGKTLPAEKGTDNRTTKRIFSLLNIIPLTKAHLRDKLHYGPETQVIATLEDLNEVLGITHGLSGISTFKMKFFNQIFNPLYRSRLERDQKGTNADGTKSEDLVALTTRDLCETYKDKKGKSISTDNVKKTFLVELLNYGIIDEQDSVVYPRQKIYTSIIDVAQTQKDVAKVTNSSNLSGLDESLHRCAINMRNNFMEIPKDWLVFEILALTKYRIRIDEITIFSHDSLGVKIKLSIKEFCEKYEKNDSLIRYFSKPPFGDFYSEIFGTMKYIEELRSKTHEKQSSRTIIDEKVTLDNIPQVSWGGRVS